MVTLWTKPDPEFSLAPASYQSTEAIQGGKLVIQRTMKNDEVDLNQKLTNYVRHDAEVVAEATEFQTVRPSLSSPFWFSDLDGSHTVFKDHMDKSSRRLV